VALDRVGGTVGPLLEEDAAGLLTLRWPDGQRRAELEVATDLLDTLLAEVNVGRRSLAVLADVAKALGRLAG
jgi:hypothetical protein